jgi:hypothetical protein
MRRREIFVFAGGAFASPIVSQGAQARTEGPQPISQAPRDAEWTLLLFCPEQGGWQTGEWCEGRWVSTADIEIVLEPTHWTDVPEPPKQAG